MDWNTGWVSVQRLFWCYISITLENIDSVLIQAGLLGVYGWVGFNLWFSSWFDNRLKHFSPVIKLAKRKEINHSWPYRGVMWVFVTRAAGKCELVPFWKATYLSNSLKMFQTLKPRLFRFQWFILRAQTTMPKNVCATVLCTMIYIM